MALVFIDAGSAILLEKSGLFHLFSTAFQPVMAPGVFKEITAPGHRGAERFISQRDQGIFNVVNLSHTHEKVVDYPKNFGEGEKETLCLYLESIIDIEPENQKRFVLIDDGPAAKWCAAQKIPFINALLVPKVLMYKHFMSKKQCLEKMKTLCSIGRYSNKVKSIAFTLTCDALSFFVQD